MKSISFLLIVFSSFVLVFAACKNDDNEEQSESSVAYNTIEKEYVLIRDVATLQASDDDISLHVDSILNGLIDAEFVSTGYKSFDLNADNTDDIAFEIIDLKEFNPNGLPQSFDHLAVRAVPLNLFILDNSTYGYADALQKGELITNDGVWTNETVVLGTFQNAGQFQGQGDRYLAFRFYGDQGFQYGWIALSCSQHNDTLKLFDFAYKTNTDPDIIAGQTE